MSKTTKDKVNRNNDRKFTDGGYKKNESLVVHRQEKRIKNCLRSNDITELLDTFQSI